ncbi:MAG: LacI family DNA-binding transcriptional regulator [Thermomicrobiales bacterium]
MSREASRERPTQSDVARVAGVSQATVSYVISGRSGSPIPEETRRRILENASGLGYVPNSVARSLRTRVTGTIASVIPDITNPFYPAFERGIQDGAERHGYVLTVYNTDGDAEKEARALRSLMAGRVDGVVGVFFYQTMRDLQPLLDRSIAVTRLDPAYDGPGDLPLDRLHVDNVGAASAATTYLIGRGHRHLAMIAGRSGPREARLLGFRQALEYHGLPPGRDVIQGGDDHAGGGGAAMGRLLALVPRPTAVFAANDVMAIGAMLTLREAGLRVPADVAVMGFDDIPMATMVSPPLTTVAQYPERLGARAVELLAERLSGRVVGGGRSVEMPFDIVVRESA